jgi:RHS repeat-associated protein
MAKNNPLRFSTKYQDDESDLLYYGYRYLNNQTGRWIGRDPSQEKGGLNLYVFAINNALIFVDARGLASVEITDIAGNVTELREPTEAQVRAAIAAFPDGAIVNFSVAGHGNQAEMYFAKKDNGIFCNPLQNNKVEYMDNGSSFPDSIRAKLAPKAHINFRGCNTAGIRIWTGQKNISNQTAFELRGIYVTGSATWRIGLYAPCGIYTGCQAGLTLPLVYYWAP